MQRIIEIAIFVFFATLLFFLIRKKRNCTMLTMGLACISAATGEFINFFVTRVTVFPPSFLLWIPGTDVPLYIICLATLVSAAIFEASLYLNGKLKRHSRLTAVVIAIALSFLLSFGEIAGVELGMWSWIRPYQTYNVFWHIGVWKYYFLFLASPAVIMLFFSKEIKKQND